VGTISNYSGKIFLLKGLVSVLLIAVAIVDCLLLNEDWRTFIKNKGLKKTILIILLLVAYLSLTLTYSSNPAYGFQKILNFLISVVPSVIVFYYLISTLTKLRTTLFVYSLGIISVLTVSYILIAYPFDQSTIYEYRAGRWSHVIYGRMISSFAVVLLLYIVAMIGRGKTRLHYSTPRQAKEERPRVLFLMFITSVAIYGTYLSAFRAGFVGLMLVGVLIISVFILRGFRNIWSSKTTPDKSAWFVVRSSLLKNLFTGKRVHSALTKNEELRTKELKNNYAQAGPGFGILSTLLVITILSALLIFFVTKPDIINYRFDNMTAIDNLQFKGDPAIHSRLDAWELSWVIIKEHPFIGTGFGGFNGYNNIEWTKMIKYPHNIILEIVVEGGVVGLLVLCSLLAVVFKNIFHFERTVNTSHVSHLTFYFLLLTFFLFTLWLALFSKDLSSQAALWIGLAFYGFEKDKRSKRKV